MYIILKHHKNVNGATVGYTLSDDKGELYLNKELVNQIPNQILNATLLNNGEFRAKSGCTIDTVIDNNNLVTVVQRPSLPKIKSENIELDYYGKKYINTCKRIRNYAISGKLMIGIRPHKSNKGKNTHLFKLIEACGVELKAFVRGYLSTIQPYSLDDFQGSKQVVNNI